MWIITFVQTLASDAKFTSSLDPCPDFRNLQRRRSSVWFSSSSDFWQPRRREAARTTDGVIFLLLLSAGKQNCRGLEEAAWQFFQIKKKFGEFLNMWKIWDSTRRCFSFTVAGFLSRQKTSRIQNSGNKTVHKSRLQLFSVILFLGVSSCDRLPLRSSRWAAVTVTASFIHTFFQDFQVTIVGYLHL